MEEIRQLQEALCNIRRAHRLLHDYQTRMLDLTYFIKMKLDMPMFHGVKHFSRTIGGSSKNISRDMWAWDFLYSYVYEYYLGSKERSDCKYSISLIQYSDTGYFDSQTRGSRNHLNSFVSDEKSCSKLLIIIEETSPKRDWIIGHSHLEDYVLNKQYASSKHKRDFVEPKQNVKQVFYSIPLEKLGSEELTLNELQKFIDYCNQCGLKAFKGLSLTSQSK